MGLSETPRPPTTVRRNPPRRVRQSLLPSPSPVQTTTSCSAAVSSSSSAASTTSTTAVACTSASIAVARTSASESAASAIASAVYCTSASATAVSCTSASASAASSSATTAASASSSSSATVDASAGDAATSVTADIISPFPLDDLLHADAQPLQKSNAAHRSSASPSTETVKVFLRVRPLELQRPRPPAAVDRHLTRPQALPRHKGKATSPKRTKAKRECLVVNNLCSVTLLDPRSLNELKKVAKREEFEGFSFVFSPESSQKEVYDKVMLPIVKDFLDGKGALLAAMGPTGSGKTYTMLGSSRNPGIVPLTLRHLFSHSNADSDQYLSRSYYLSMFEIQSEGGKGERILDLLSDGGDLSLHQSSVQGLHEVVVSSVVEAENILARGMQKRCTATTNANSKSSRSQCIINIRRVLKNRDNDVRLGQDSNVLTIADLAGSEKERRTGNQGVRLMESSFINNTSMVLGLCLRSLLEHQKNPKKPLQKHFKNSMLTRFLKEYLEGKKRMTLILNVKSGVDDYLDTSFFLRQVSPYTRIKYNCPDDLPNLPSRRRMAVLTRDEMAKKRKFSRHDSPFVDRGQGDIDDYETQQIPGKECQNEIVQEFELRQDSSISLGCSKLMDADKEIDNGNYIVQKTIITNKEEVKLSPHDCSGLSTCLMGIKTDNSVGNETHIKQQKVTRNEEVMMGFTKALWNVLKEYKKNLEASENEVQGLKVTLEKERAHVAELKREIKNLRSASRHEHSLEELSSQLETANSDQSHADSYEISDPDAPVSTANDHVVDLTTKETSVDVDTPGNEAVTHTLVKATCCNLLAPQEGVPQPENLTVDPEKKNYACGDHMKKGNISAPSPALAVKPKRRLLPASTLLRKEFCGIDMEAAEIKGNKVKATPGRPARSQGSTQLIRLLKENFHH